MSLSAFPVPVRAVYNLSVPRFLTLIDENPNNKKTLRCGLCPHTCVLNPGETGLCGIRQNIDGKPSLPSYGFVTALATDPIEKKPLYHFRPGTEILSAGFTGCNLHCPFCQNWRISQKPGASGRDIYGSIYNPSKLLTPPGKPVEAVSYTYSEPLVHIEFLLDCMREARKASIANILVTNGCINTEAADEILSLTDAANIDLKCFSEDTYRNILGGKLSTVLDFIQLAFDKGVHLEITTLVVPGLNDSREELDRCRDFIVELETSGKNAGTFVPWHLSAYHPNYKMQIPGTDPASLITAANRAREKLKYVYTGNIPQGKDGNKTPCPRCGKILISRHSYKVDISGLSLKATSEGKVYFCNHCGEHAPIKW